MDHYLKPAKPTTMIVDKTYNKTKKCEEDYEFEEIIGEGTFSDVVRGIHLESNKPFAIKIIDKAKVTTEKQRWRIRNEINLQKKCKHPFITYFVDYYESDTDICIVLELCEGGELFNRIVEKGCFSEKDAMHVMKQIGAAVQFLHSKGIVHRDIKPENILYTSKDDSSVVKLADFGLAKELESETLSGRSLLKASLSGTPAYCAPERLQEDQETKAVDMWSLGCIMYFLLFGVPPFYSNKEDEEECDDEIIDSVIEGSVSFPSDRTISEEAKDLISHLLEKDPTKRCTVEEMLAHPWLKSHHDDEQKVNDNNDLPSSKAKNAGRDDRMFLKCSINKIIDFGETMGEEM